MPVRRLDEGRFRAGADKRHGRTRGKGQDPVVGQKDRAAGGGVAGELEVGLHVAGAGQGRHGLVAGGDFEYAGGRRVEGRRVEVARRNGMGRRFDMVGLGTGRHQVAAGRHRLRAVGGAVVERNHRARKAPFLAQKILQKRCVFGAFDSVAIAGRHRHGPGPALAHGNFEGAQVEFVQGALVDDVVAQVGNGPARHAAQDAAEGAGAHALNPADPRGGHLAGEQGVLPHRFGRGRPPSAQFGAAHHGGVVGAGLFAHRLAHRFCQARVEGAGERGGRGKASGSGVGVDLAVARIEGQAVRGMVEAGGNHADMVDAGRRVARLTGEQARLLFDGELRERCDDILLCLHPAVPSASAARRALTPAACILVQFT